MDQALKVRIEAILKLAENDEGLVLHNLNTNNCSPEDNFMSITTVVDVKYSTSSGEHVTKSLFIKLLPENKRRCDLFPVRDAFQNESYICVQVLRLIPEIKDIIPKYIFGEEEIIVMENLGAFGYKMANKNIGLDLKHSEIVMKALGKFHASTFNLFLKRSENNIENSMSTNVRDIRLKTSFFVAETERNVSLGVRTLRLARDPLLQPAISKLEDMINSGSVINTLLSLYDSDVLKVICHGDFWINNMMFSYDRERVDSVRLLDFQGVILASPAIDLWTFFYSSISIELLNSCYDHLMSVYCTSFTDTLKDLDIQSKQIPEIEHIRYEVDSRELYGFSIAMMYVKLACADLEDLPADVDTCVGREGATMNLSAKPNVVKRFSEIAKRCISRGVFDDFRLIK